MLTLALHPIIQFRGRRVRCHANDPHGEDGDANNGLYNAAQKLGKKARRRYLQLRRELQQQQGGVAAEMGVGGGQQGNMVIQRPIEEQLADAEDKNDTGVYDHIPLIVVCRNYNCWRWWN